MINKSHSSMSDRDAIHSMTSIYRYNFIGTLFQALNFIVGIAAIPLRLFLRKDIGERSIRPISFFLSIALHIFYFTIFDILLLLGIMELLDDMSYEGSGAALKLTVAILLNPYLILLIMSIVFGVKHFKQKIEEGRNNQTYYSYSRGKSRFFKPSKTNKVWGFIRTEDMVRLLVEPRFVFVFGLLTFAICLSGILYFHFISENAPPLLLSLLISFGCTGLVLMFDAICLFADEMGIFLQQRDKALDILDAREDATTILGIQNEIEKNRQSTNSHKREDDISTTIEEDAVEISTNKDFTFEDISGNESEEGARLNNSSQWRNQFLND